MNHLTRHIPNAKLETNASITPPGFLLAFFLFAAPVVAKDSPPNIVFINTDDQGLADAEAQAIRDRIR